ncbi:MAG TPA: serine hydrolase domain-containing protein, partial [Blastocatellia bacterium]
PPPKERTMSKSLTTLALIFCSFFSNPVFIASGQPALPAFPLAENYAPLADEAIIKGDLGRRLDQHLNRLADFGFSGSVLVAKGRQIVFHKAYGLADRARNIPVSTATVFDIASITKQFTAAALLRLEMAGKLKTSDPINKFLPNVPDDKSAITLEHLLTHTSGMGGVLNGTESVTRDQFIAGILRQPLASKPGTAYAYSNAGFTLLAALIELVSGQTYETFLSEQLFKPAGMTNTGFYEDKSRWDSGLVAHGYDEDTDKGAPTEWKPDYRFRGSSYVLTTAGDLFKWEMALRGDAILSKEAKRKFFSAPAPTDEPGRSYGYGWVAEKTARRTALISHDGIGFGFNSIFQRYTDEDVTIVALSNKLMGRFLPMAPLGRDLSAIVFDGKTTELPASIPAAKSSLEKFAGVYRLPSGAQLKVVSDGNLKISAEGQEAIELLAGATASERKTLEDLSSRARAALEGVARGNFDPMIKEMKGRAEPDEIKKDIGDWWARFTNRHGQFKSLDVLGTVPETEAMMTYVRLNFERGEEYRRCRWENGSLAYILLVALPLIPTHFVAKSETEFYGYHLGLARIVRISFNADGLVFYGTDGKHFAQRLK